MRRPHLVLPHIGGHDAIREHNAVFGQPAEKFVEKANRRLGETPGIKFGSLGSAGHCPPATEVRSCMTPQFRLECRNRICQISNHRQIARTHAIELRGVDFKVNDPAAAAAAIKRALAK